MKLTISMPKVSKTGKVALPAIPKVSIKGGGAKLPSVSVVKISTVPKGLKSLL